ncbi:MAG: glycosyltransferase family 4 protein [Rhizobiaceae bacterium]|nr:glycosyltransferase family 4 protein [Rhizobiaceae bacterium]
MKHVWIVNHYAEEPGGSSGTRHYSLAKRLPGYGWKASIVAASTGHNTGRQRLAPDESTRLDHLDGVPFLWLRTRTYRGNGLARVGNIFDYTRAVLRRDNLLALEPPDIVLGSSVHPFAAWAGRRLARRNGVPFVFEVRDLWPQTLIDMGRLPRYHPITFTLRWLEKSLYKSASRIVVLLPLAADYIVPLGISPERIKWVPNGVDLEDFPAFEQPSDDGGFSLMFFGAHGEANGLDTVVRAMDLVRQHSAGSGIRLRLIGDGPRKPALVQLARELGATNITFEDPIPRHRIPETAAQADGFLFNLADIPVFKYGVSANKLFDFMAAQRPIIYCCRSGNNPIEEAGSGITVAPGNPEALAAAIIRLAHLPHDERTAMGLAGRAHVEQNYGLNSLAGRLADMLDEALDR